ncbi:MFS transporter, YNFM family, putative membrane transport protein [Rhodanobacter glycinis]|uniref:MFS transporter, YNFM family, putative membrane transport protein n=2 Tax=Rhodanobacter glycinis TaxID=582702 RepID=A0A1I4E7K1_9GAMM|nr:MFS transporter [Rhodanobacter glycinis]SFL00326.1 MFS transporter, YNFM family, putative membrane transport protein [Rhodanobacter glycinis]
MNDSDTPGMTGATAAANDWIHHGTPAFRRTNLALFAAGLATFGLLYCVQPLMPEFNHDYGVSAADSALSLSLTTGVLAVAMLFAGGLSDAWGRKSVMVASILSSAVLVLVTAAMPNWGSLLVVRTLLGLTLSGLPAVAMTYLSEEMHPESIGLGMGLYISGSAVGGMGGRLVTGVLTDFFDWRVGVVVVGVIGIVSGLVFWRALPPSRHFVRQPLSWRALAGRFSGMFHDPGLPWLFLEGFLLLGAFVTVYNYLGYRLLAPPFNLSQAVVGLIFGIYLIGTFSSAWMGHLAGKLGRRKVLWTAFALMLVGVLLTLTMSLWLIMLGIVAVTFGFFGGHSIVSSWVGRRAGAAKAQASSMYLFCYYMGSSVAGYAGGLFYTRGGWDGVAAFIGALVVAGLVIALGLYRLRPLVNVATMPTPMSKGAMP